MAQSLQLCSERPIRGLDLKCRVLDDVIDSDLLNAAYQCHLGRAPVPSTWIPLDGGASLTMPVSGDRLVQLATQILLRVYNDLLAPPDKVCGIEFWTNVRKRCAGQKYHVDTDEQLLLRAKVLRTPLYTMVIHLGPRAGVVGGSTVINTEGVGHFLEWLHKIETYELFGLSWPMYPSLEDPLPANWVRIDPRFNRTILFNGDYPHFVEPIKGLPEDGQGRVTLVGNVWHRPLDRLGVH